MTEMMDEYRVAAGELAFPETERETCRYSMTRHRWERETSPGKSTKACGHEEHVSTWMDDREVFLAVEKEPMAKSEPETEAELADTVDPVNHPPHYVNHPSGIECIQITEHMNFCIGNAVKYLWRADLKGNSIEDLGKARWYVDREIARRRAAK